MTRLTSLSQQVFKTYRAELKKEGLEPSSINGYIRTVGGALNLAVERRYLNENPLKGFKKLPEVQKIIVPYTKAEIVALLRAAREWDRQKGYRHRRSGRTYNVFPIIATGILAGLRRGEIVVLEWTDLDWERSLVLVRAKPALGFKPKWYHERAVPLEPQLRQILEPMKRPKGLCFPNGLGRKYANNLLRDVKAVAESAGLDPQETTVHRLRHEYASHQIMRAIPPNYLMQWMGHRDPETLLRYTHLAPGSTPFDRPSIFQEGDIVKLLDALSRQQAPVVRLPGRNRLSNGSKSDGPRIGKGQ